MISLTHVILLPGKSTMRVLYYMYPIRNKDKYTEGDIEEEKGFHKCNYFVLGRPASTVTKGDNLSADLGMVESTGLGNHYYTERHCLLTN